MVASYEIDRINNVSTPFVTSTEEHDHGTCDATDALAIATP